MKTDADHLAEIRGLITPSDAVAWIKERHANCLRIAATKTDAHDRAGWLTDAAFFEAAITLLDAATARQEGAPGFVHLVAQREYELSSEAYDRLAAQVDAGMKHSGDCTNECHTCLVCQIGEIRQGAAAYAAAARPSAPSEAQVEASLRLFIFAMDQKLFMPDLLLEAAEKGRAVLSAIGQGKDERADALYDSAYIAGMKAGYNFGVAEDQEGLAAAIKARDGYLAPLARHASRQAGEPDHG